MLFNKKNPFDVFKSLGVCLKDPEAEKAYNEYCKSNMLRPFQIIKIMGVYYIYLALYGLFFIILRGLGMSEYSQGPLWLVMGVGGFIATVILNYISYKLPKLNNPIGIALILGYYIFSVETGLRVNKSLENLVSLLSFQFALLCVTVEHINSLSIGVIAQTLGICYATIRLLYIFQYQDMELYLFTAAKVCFLFFVVIFGLVRWKKVTFYDLYRQSKLNSSFKNTMDILPDGIVILNKDQVKYNNLHAFHILNISGEEHGEVYDCQDLMLRKIKHLTPCNPPQIPLEEVPSETPRNIFEDEESSFSESLFSLEGNKLLTISKKPIYFNEENMSLIAIKDISTLRQLEETKSQVKYKSMLMATISHDMRTPVNAIQAMLEMITLSTNDACKTYTTIAKGSCNLLLHLIHDILDYSKLEQNEIQLNMEYFNLKDAIVEVQEMLMFQIESKGLQFDVNIFDSVQEEIFGDQKRFQQILLNLLSNAVKFTQSGIIQLTAWMQNNLLQVAVSDTGLGIKEENLSKLFKPFGMLSDTKDINKYGTGLGLYLCRGFSQMMGGEIKVSSIVGEGTTFTFWISAGPQPPPSIYTMPSDTAEGTIIIGTVCNPSLVSFSPNYSETCIRTEEKDELITEQAEIIMSKSTSLRISREKSNLILIVDDSPYNLFALNSLLSSLKVGSENACNGKVAYEKCKEDMYKYAFVLMDCNMPVMDGFEATVSIRKIEREQNVIHQLPIFGLTGNEDEESLQKCRDSGMNEAYPKPISMKLLKELVAKHIQLPS